MKPEIENLRARMMGMPLNKYQMALSKMEFVKLLDYVAELEQLRIHDVVGRSEQLVCDNQRPDLEHFMNYSESICKNCKQKV